MQLLPLVSARLGLKQLLLFLVLMGLPLVTLAWVFPFHRGAIALLIACHFTCRVERPNRASFVKCQSLPGAGCLVVDTLLWMPWPTSGW